MYLFNGKKINIDAPFTDSEGRTVPNFRDPAERERYGVQELPDPIYPDPELYFWTENEDGSLVITEKPAEMVAQTKQAKLNAESLAYLAETDWMITRFAETGTPIPEEVKAKRQAARDAIK